MKSCHRYSGIALSLVLLVPAVKVWADFQWIDRPEPMQIHRLLDFDRTGDRVRILYMSMPSLQQAKSPDASRNIYVAELHPDGRVENRQLTSGKRTFAWVLLQRGGDAVFVVPALGHGKRSDGLEVWSAQDGSVLSSFRADALAGPGGPARPIFPTDDGNLFVVEHSAQTGRGGEPTTLTWYKFSPEGEVLAKGQWTNPTATTGLGGAFAVPGGGLGLSVNMMLARDMHVLDTDFQQIQEFEVGGRKFEARVHSETRLLTTDSSGSVAWLSPALQRGLMWDGDMTIPQDLPVDQMMAQNAEQMALMSRISLESGERQVVHQSTTEFDDVQLTANGFGMLAKMSADRSLEPPMHGTWFIEIDKAGSLRRELRLEPIAEQLDGKVERFLPTSDGGLLVAGRSYRGGSNLHVTYVDQGGTTRWTAQVGGETAQLEGLAGTLDAPWVFGQGWSDAHQKNLLWVELVDSDSAQPFGARTAGRADNSTAVSQSSAKADAFPGFQMPEPPEGCECSCEEFAAIQKLMEGMKSLPQAELMAKVQDPAYQKAMTCSGGCAMAYVQCK